MSAEGLYVLNIEPVSKGLADRIAEAQAKRHVAYYLLQLDDKSLEEAGFNREELSKIASTRYF